MGRSGQNIMQATAMARRHVCGVLPAAYLCEACERRRRCAGASRPRIQTTCGSVPPRRKYTVSKELEHGIGYRTEHIIKHRQSREKLQAREKQAVKGTIIKTQETGRNNNQITGDQRITRDEAANKPRTMRYTAKNEPGISHEKTSNNL